MSFYHHQPMFLRSKVLMIEKTVLSVMLTITNRFLHSRLRLLPILLLAR
ncbi:Uncharacterised protein [Vibrio cholerae]|nr:Uncharacterised protein [Vibrio cholerae]